MTNPSHLDTLAVVGAGVMGRGIAQLALQSGKRVLLTDMSTDALDAAALEIGQRLDRLVEKNLMSAEDVRMAKTRLTLADTIANLDAADLVIEAIVEKLDIKRALVKSLEDSLPDTVLIATNTSSFLVAEIAQGAQRPEQILGLHFFNPAPLMKLVEVVPGPLTAPRGLEKARAFCTELGRVAIDAADANGFIVNRLGRGYVLEAARAAEDGLADFQTIDSIMTGLHGFRLGPFALMDLTGLDVTYPASRSIWAGNGYDSRLVPPGLLERRLKAGLLGRKSGSGFLTESASSPLQMASALPEVFVGQQAGEGLRQAMVNAGFSVTDQSGDAAFQAMLADGMSVLNRAQKHGLVAEALVLVDCDAGGADHLALSADPETAARLRSKLPKNSVSIQNDSAGTIAQRIILQLALISGDMVQQGAATEADIDTAAKLGLGHPEGPLERVRRLGAARWESLRAAIFAETGLDRFRPCMWLSRAAQEDSE